MKSEKIVIDEKALRKRYSIRRTGRFWRSWETTIPKEVIEREARVLGIPIDKIEDALEVEWRFNSFRGLHMVLIPKKEKVVSNR
jgi:hypothetical protein